MRHTAPLLLMVGLSACALLPDFYLPLGEDEDEAETEPQREDLIPAILANTATRVVAPALESFKKESGLLDEAVRAWSTAPDDATLAAAQQQWVTTMVSWQYLEVMQIGPAGAEWNTTGGMDLRDEIYSWPLVSGCRVDQETTYGEWMEPDWLSDQIVMVYGLDALEHLLFAGMENDCPDQLDINADGSWDAMSDADIVTSRSKMAEEVARHLASTGSELHAQWVNEFSPQLLDASLYESSEHALGEVYSALLYISYYTEDRKLGQPLGLLENTQPVPEDVEHPLSGISVASISTNLVGSRALFTGDGGPGFDEFLAAMGHADLSEAFLLEVDEAIEAAAAIDQPLEEAIIAGDPLVGALHSEIADVSALLDGDILTVLTLQIPIDTSIPGSGD